MGGLDDGDCLGGVVGDDFLKSICKISAEMSGGRNHDEGAFP